ncbi:hypothetical protein C8F01DRAFT_1371234 [Mycena amicta]|nr:hypothetical protein C8F01DRAFT_1371234 [Mycena amicta]
MSVPTSQTPPYRPIRPRTLAPLNYEVLLHRQRVRNEKARLHMARKRAELKLRPLQEQQEAAERARLYRACYRQRHREAMRLGEDQRRARIYLDRYGEVAYQEYLERRFRLNSADCQPTRQGHTAAHDRSPSPSSSDTESES